MRLDQAIAARFPNLSRRKARELIAAGRVMVNQRSVRVASRDVADDAQLTIVGDQPMPPILKITDEWLAVDKPPGLPSQPTRDRALTSLEELLRAEYREIWLVHRLDTAASGVILFARTQPAAARLSKLFAEGEIRKFYLAIVDEPFSATIDTPIDGKNALTIVRPLRDKTVEVEIKTGRTHQIRRHLSSAGHPIVGDRHYGGSKATRLMLHAWKLEHPSIGVVEAPPPAAFM